jgi:DNA-binding Lrp family transcriptional regulator
MITVSPRMTSSIINSMELIEGVRNIYSVSGPHDLITEVAALNMAELDAMIDRIIEIDGVERTVSSVILSTRLKR